MTPDRLEELEAKVERMDRFLRILLETPFFNRSPDFFRLMREMNIPYDDVNSNLTQGQPNE